MPKLAIAALFVFSGTIFGIDRPRPVSPQKEVTVTLVGRAGNLGTETVNFGLPLPPGFLNDVSLVHVRDSRGVELDAAVRSLEPWRIDGTDGTIRSIQIQFQADFQREKTRQFTIAFGKPCCRHSRNWSIWVWASFH